MSLLNTSNPIALQVLMTDTIFNIDIQAPPTEEVSPEVTPAQKETKLVLKTLGGNNKNILFVISDNNNEFLSPEAEIAFMKILRALKLDLKDIVVLNHRESLGNITFEKIENQLKPEKCIFMGINPQLFEIKACAKNILTSTNNVQLLYTYSFDEMLKDTEKKRLFWDAIKLMNL